MKFHELLLYPQSNRSLKSLFRDTTLLDFINCIFLVIWPHCSVIIHDKRRAIVEALVFVNIAFQRRVGLFRRTAQNPTRR